MLNAALSPSAGALAKEVCDRLLKKGLLKAKPEFIRKDREAKLSEIFGKANLDGGTLPSIGGRKRLEVHLLSVTAGEACAWLGNVVNELAEMVQDGAFQVRSENGDVQSHKAVSTAMERERERARRLEMLGSEDLASGVCDRLVERGLVKAESTCERRGREMAGISSLLRTAHIDGEALAGFRDRRSLEQHLLNASGSDTRLHLESSISDLAEMLLELASFEQAGTVEDAGTAAWADRPDSASSEQAGIAEDTGTAACAIQSSAASFEQARPIESAGTTAGADQSSSVQFETASDGLDKKTPGASSSTASPPPSRPPRLEAVAARVCTRLVEKGLLKKKPAFVRTDREASICTLLRKAGLEGAALTAYSDKRSLQLRLQGALNGEACAWLDNAVAELVELSQGNDDLDAIAPAQKSPVKGEHNGAGLVDTPRSMASCSTSDSIKEIPPQKRVSFSAAPPEVVHVVPYSEVYSFHPDKFEFDSDGRYITDDESIDPTLRSAVRPEQKYRPPGARGD